MSSSMSKVYLVTYGEYSDWTVHSIHSTPERANAVVERMKAENERSGSSYFGPYPSPSVDEWEVDAYTVPQVPQGMSIYRIVIPEDGMARAEYWGDEDDYDRLRDEEAADQGESWMDRFGTFVTFTFARDKDHAAKIAYDRRAKFLAEKENIA